MPKLDRIEIKGFKSIQEADIPLSSLNILIGANGAGKSNFLSTFKFLSQIIKKNLQLFVGQSGGASKLLYLGPKVTDQIKVRLYFGENGYQIVLVPAREDTLRFADESYWHNDLTLPPPGAITHTFRGHSESVLHVDAYGEPASFASFAFPLLKSLENWTVYHFQDTSESAKVKATSGLNDNISFRGDAANLAPFLYLLRETKREHYNRIVEVIRLVAPFFDDFVLRPNPLNPSTILLQWLEKGSEEHFDAQMLSDGTLRFICLTTLLFQPEELLPTIILIDEPELGLHPYAIALLGEMLKSVATKTQVIVSTQSAPLINLFEPEDVIVVDRINGSSTFRRLNSKELTSWLEVYSLGELWQKNIIGGRPQR